MSELKNLENEIEKQKQIIEEARARQKEIIEKSKKQQAEVEAKAKKKIADLKRQQSKQQRALETHQKVAIGGVLYKQLKEIMPTDREHEDLFLEVFANTYYKSFSNNMFDLLKRNYQKELEKRGLAPASAEKGQ